MSEETKVTLSLDDAQGSGMKPFIEPGIHEVEIVGSDNPDESVTGNREFKTLRIVTIDGTSEIMVRFYHSRASGNKQAAVLVSCKQLNHILEACVGKEEYAKMKVEATFDILEGEDEHDVWVKMYNWIIDNLIGRKLRMKFIGEEKADGRIITRLGFPPFAENLGVMNTRLKFDPNNKWDMKKAPPDLLDATTDSSDDLPI